MHHIEAEIEIAATLDRVWRVLADFPAYANWNPFVLSISGAQTEGSRLSVTIQPEGGKPMSFKPTLLVFAPRRELRWKGRFLLPGVLDGEHYFQLTEISAGRARLAQGEMFSGLLVPLASRGSTLAGTARGFAAMNRALKARAEAAP